MRTKKPEIIYIKMEGPAGGWNVTHDFIMVDPRLKKYPALHDFVIQHELGHRNHDKNILQCIIRDMRDYPRLWLMKDFDKFVKDRKIKRPLWKSVMETFQTFAYFMAQLFMILPATLIIVLSVKIWRRLKNEKIRRNEKTSLG